MGRKALIGAMTTVAVIGSVLGSSFNSANADSCTYTFQAPVSGTHEIDVPEFRFKFEIPANYRSQKNKDSSEVEIHVFDPGLLLFIEGQSRPPIGCTIVSGEQAENTGIYLKISPVPENFTNLKNYITTQNTGPQGSNILSLSSINIGNQKGFLYQLGADDDTLNVTFLTTDNQSIVTIEMIYPPEKRPEDRDSYSYKPIFDQIVSTFKFY